MVWTKPLFLNHPHVLKFKHKKEVFGNFLFGLDFSATREKNCLSKMQISRKGKVEKEQLGAEKIPQKNFC